MRYQYVYQYKDLKNDSLKKMSAFTDSKITVDELFLDPFIHYAESVSGAISYEGKDSCPLKISELRGDSAILFTQMEFKVISGQQNLLKSLGFGRRKKR